LFDVRWLDIGKGIWSVVRWALHEAVDRSDALGLCARRENKGKVEEENY
jgi:hypothetical protein